MGEWSHPSMLVHNQRVAFCYPSNFEGMAYGTGKYA
ncbi:hypothetical protein M948_04470 [Virgibacillus sp. CM-4]|nr:hypothetical protein M948_04470 [Virgibacillus sp. CM-4]